MAAGVRAEVTGSLTGAAEVAVAGAPTRTVAAARWPMLAGLAPGPADG